MIQKNIYLLISLLLYSLVTQVSASLTLDQIRSYAEAGAPEAQYELARHYYVGIGIEKNYKEAVKWYGKAAIQGLPQAQYNLGHMYFSGEGVEADYQRAAELFQTASSSGIAEAHFKLGLMYYNGQHFNKDNVMSHYHFGLASSGGFNNGDKAQSLLEREMSQQQLEEAKRMANDGGQSSAKENDRVKTVQERKPPQSTDLPTSPPAFYTAARSKNQLAAENRAAGHAFLADNKKREGVIVTSTGLQYEVLKMGEASGKSPKRGDSVEVHYRVLRTDGRETDSSYRHGRPSIFALHRVVPGFAEGLKLMKEGSKYRFVVPSDLAYGSNGQGDIGPNETLIYEVELSRIMTPPSTRPPSGPPSGPPPGRPVPKETHTFNDIYVRNIFEGDFKAIDNRNRYISMGNDMVEYKGYLSLTGYNPILGLLTAVYIDVAADMYGENQVNGAQLIQIENTWTERDGWGNILSQETDKGKPFYVDSKLYPLMNNRAFSQMAMAAAIGPWMKRMGDVRADVRNLLADRKQMEQLLDNILRRWDGNTSAQIESGSLKYDDRIYRPW